VLRVEDLDRPRVVAGAAEGIVEDLRWLGIDWDEGPDVGGPCGPYVQSARASLYEDALARLDAAARLYPCTCSRRDVLLASSAPHGDLGPVYPGTCRAGPSRPGRPEALRFRMLAEPEAFVDRVHGRVAPSRGDDFVVKRADGPYAYQLAVVVDDIAMGITEVVRGADLLTSTPWQIALHRALGREPPSFLHVPLVLGPDGERLAKREASAAIAEFRAAGVAAERIVGRLAHTLGLAGPDEACRPADLVERFDPARLPTAPTVLDPERLVWW
jgi:glutamyl-tRNA synthetase